MGLCISNSCFDYYDNIMVVMKMKHNFRRGQIVRWHKDLWIIAEVRSNNEGLTGLQLIASRSSNVGAGPTLKWPSEKTGVQAVEIIADCMQDFYVNKVMKVFE